MSLLDCDIPNKGHQIQRSCVARASSITHQLEVGAEVSDGINNLEEELSPFLKRHFWCNESFIK
jgi:hypothetical protein